ncbi:guanine nucleotide exchange factor for Rab-3A-like isoform X2 [Apostichopus japonicus]
MTEIGTDQSNILEKKKLHPTMRVKSYSESHLENGEESNREDENDNIPEDGDDVEGEKTESDQDQYHEDQPLGSPRSPVGRTASISLDEMRAHAFEKLQEELMKAQEALELKDEQVSKLSKVRDEMDQEIVELTANLFQEAHKMVNEANVGQAGAQKLLEEANGKIEVLQAEVQALKALVITSTPSTPNKQSDSHNKMSLLRRRKKNNPSHHRNHSLTGPIGDYPDGTASQMNGNSPDSEGAQQQKEVDPLFLRDLQTWRESPTLHNDSSFMNGIFLEDVRPCLNFPSQETSATLQECVAVNYLSIEPISGKSSFPRRCSLTDQQRPCRYRIKLGDSDSWINICSAARDRIAAVCNYYTYLRYIQQGLVKSDLNEMYWEIIRLRKAMSLAKLGLPE